MALLYKQVQLQADESFFIGIFQDNLEKGTWHYHNDYEISFLTEGSGKRIVGDSIEEFHPGDLIFIGPQLPHVWMPEKYYLDFPSGRTLESVYLLFNEKILPQPIISLPEFSNVFRAMKLAQRGVQITGETLEKVSEIMLQLPFMKSFARLVSFYNIMDIIGKSDTLKILASEDYMKTKFSSGNKRINTIHEYLMNNYKSEISLDEIADKVHMATGSLCRFFKSHTGISIFEYLNKIKVDYACKLLMDKELNITDISYDCGFNNLSHFNRQFKKFMSATPSDYRHQFKGLIS